MNAYDIIISETGKDGWCGGMPPGIKPAQWCRSRKSGLPMKHLFTVRVPEEYRARGKTFVAISVFQDLTDKRIEGVEESFRRKQVKREAPQNPILEKSVRLPRGATRARSLCQTQPRRWVGVDLADRKRVCRANVRTAPARRA